MTKDETFYFLENEMRDLDDRQRELYENMLRKGGEIVDIDEYLDTLYLGSI